MRRILDGDQADVVAVCDLRAAEPAEHLLVLPRVPALRMQPYTLYQHLCVGVSGCWAGQPAQAAMCDRHRTATTSNCRYSPPSTHLHFADVRGAVVDQGTADLPAICIAYPHRILRIEAAFHLQHHSHQWRPSHFSLRDHLMLHLCPHLVTSGSAPTRTARPW